MKTEEKYKDKVEVSVVFPAYNEADQLERAVDRTTDALEKITPSFEIIIAEDGSTDGTDKVASELSRKYPFVRHIHSEKRLGRGIALKNAFQRSIGEILVYMDVDMATDVRHLSTLVKSIREGYDIAIGSRMLPESRVERSSSRRIASKSYNLLVRVLLGSKIRDHQCGFKSFKREPLLQLLEEVTSSHWFWDTELLVRATRKGHKIKEFPVDWKSGSKTRVNLVKDSFGMMSQVLKFWWRLKTASLFGQKS